jgi:hypothetical protein
MNTGGPAFPTTKPLDSWGDPNRGMTLRDYFAAKAMHGMCCDPERWPQEKDMPYITKIAYQMADAMLKAREQ